MLVPQGIFFEVVQEEETIPQTWLWQPSTLSRAHGNHCAQGRGCAHSPEPVPSRPTWRWETAVGV